MSEASERSNHLASGYLLPGDTYHAEQKRSDRRGLYLSFGLAFFIFVGGFASIVISMAGRPLAAAYFIGGAAVLFFSYGLFLVYISARKR